MIQDKLYPTLIGQEEETDIPEEGMETPESPETPETPSEGTESEEGASDEEI